MEKSLGSVLIILALCTNAGAQRYPYPQKIKYPYGYIPTTINPDHVKSEYERFVSTAFTKCDDTMNYITCDNHGISPSPTTGKAESVGFGMWLFAFMGERQRFDAMYNFYKRNLNDGIASGMMGWLGTCNGNNYGMATDGEVDVAFSLIVAHWQWPDGGYLTGAKKVLELMKKVIIPCGDISVLAMGVDFGGCNKTDISYYNPAAFREFAKVVESREDSVMWVKMAEDTYKLIDASAHPATGLVPNQQTVTGKEVVGGYMFDACRTPWRVCLDYLWNGNEKARAWCKKLSEFAFNYGVDKVGRPFNIDGTSKGGAGGDMSFLGGFAIAAMANSQEMVDAFGKHINSIKPSHWFGFSLEQCYLLTLTGNQWRGDISTSTSINPNKSIGANPRFNWNSLSHSPWADLELQPGYSIILTTLSGRQLRYGKIEKENYFPDLSALNNGRAILTVRDDNQNVLRSGWISVRY